MPASSPCVGVCVIDEAAGLCRGCGRTLPEIAGWGSLSEPQRRAVMATLQRRLLSTPQDLGRTRGPDLPGKPDAG